MITAVKLKSIFKDAPNLIVVGANWGDEGKGKIIDLIMAHYDVTARFSGGANAGHTVFTPDGKKLVSHLIPCGLAQGKICVLGRGEFFNLELFLAELEHSRRILGENNLPPIYIDYQSPVWTPYHGLLESYVEELRGAKKIGTTNKGIAPLEALYKLRLGPVVGYLREPKLLEESLEVLYKMLLPILRAFAAGEKIPPPKQVSRQLLLAAPRVKPIIADTAYFLDQAARSGKRILFEGAQALGLDSHWGTYPFVSAGNSAASGAALGTGLPMGKFSATLMVVKILPTRVGSGPMPSEMWERSAVMEFAKNNGELFIANTDKRADFLSQRLLKINKGQASNAEASQYFQVLGDERGATTGRGRSLGFLDIPWLHYAIRVNGPKWLALTRFDMLSGIKTIPVVVGYKLKGKLLRPGQMPPPWELADVKPVFEQWPGWPQNIGGIDQEPNLPKAARNFLSRLEKRLKTPILLVGTGPARNAIVVRSVKGHP